MGAPTDSPFGGFILRTSDLRARLGEVLGQGMSGHASHASGFFCCTCESLPRFVTCDTNCVRGMKSESTSSRHNSRGKELEADEVRGSPLVPFFSPNFCPQGLLDALAVSSVPPVVDLDGQAESDEEQAGFKGGFKQWPNETFDTKQLEANEVGLHIGPPITDFIIDGVWTDVVPLGHPPTNRFVDSRSMEELRSPDMSLPHAAQAKQLDPRVVERGVPAQRHTAAVGRHSPEKPWTTNGQPLQHTDMQASIGTGYLRLRRLKKDKSSSYSPRSRNADSVSTISPDAGSNGNQGSVSSRSGFEGLLSL